LEARKFQGLLLGWMDGIDDYVQDNAITDGQHTAVILCGQKEMGEAVTALVEEKGVSKDMILTNF
jgi:NAD(P)H-flavin reductase